MKKKIISKKFEKVLIFILGVIFASGLNVLADACTTTLSSTEITYGSTDVKSALDDLYAVNTGTAGASQVLTGYTFSNDSDIGLAGTMANNGAVSESVGVGGSYTIPAGYHNGSGTVTGPTLSGDAGAANVLTGKTFYSNSGTKQTGTMANNGSWSKTVSSTTAQTGGAGYYSSVSCAKAANTGTFTTSTNSTAVDMGANQNYRYVNTSGVKSSWVQLWTGTATGNVSTSLSGYSYVYLRVENTTGYGGTGSWALLKVGGAEKCAGVKVPIQGSYRQYTPVYKATTSGVNLMAASNDDVATIAIKEIWGVKTTN